MNLLCRAMSIRHSRRRWKACLSSCWHQLHASEKIRKCVIRTTMKITSRSAATSKTSARTLGSPSSDLRQTVVAEEVGAVTTMAPVETTVTENSRDKRAEREVAATGLKQRRRRSPANVTNWMTTLIRWPQWNEPEKPIGLK